METRIEKLQRHLKDSEELLRQLYRSTPLEEDIIMTVGEKIQFLKFELLREKDNGDVSKRPN